MSRLPRKARTLVRISVEFQGLSEESHIKGKGRTLDLNVNGCRVESHTAVPRGSYLQLHLTVPTAPKLITIGMARVRWVQSGAFGVEFIQRSADDIPYINQVMAEAGEHKNAVAHSIQRRMGPVPCTVLIVEDDPDVLHLCARTMEGIGCKVLKASGSSEALQICAAHKAPIHIMLVDLILRPPVFQLQSGQERYPRVHGHALIDLVVRIRKKCHVVYMSGHDEKALNALGIQIGGALCLQKPFSREDLLVAVDQALASSPVVWDEASYEKPARKAANDR